MAMECAHCGGRAPAGMNPSPGDMLFCIFCGGIAIWDAAGGWRDMTREEHRERLDDAAYLAALDHLMEVRGFIERDRANMLKVITGHLRGSVYPWLNPDTVASGLADSLIRSGFHAMHQEESDGD